jgi:hypothetical protein
VLGRSGTLNFGSTVSPRRYLRIVFRDNPVRRSISRIGTCCRKCQRRITLNNALSITPGFPDQSARRRSKHGSVSVKISGLPGSHLNGIQHSAQVWHTRGHLPSRARVARPSQNPVVQNPVIQLAILQPSGEAALLPEAGDEDPGSAQHEPENGLRRRLHRSSTLLRRISPVRPPCPSPPIPFSHCRSWRDASAPCRAGHWEP